MSEKIVSPSKIKNSRNRSTHQQQVNNARLGGSISTRRQPSSTRTHAQNEQPLLNFQIPGSSDNTTGSFIEEVSHDRAMPTVRIASSTCTGACAVVQGRTEKGFVPDPSRKLNKGLFNFLDVPLGTFFGPRSYE